MRITKHATRVVAVTALAMAAFTVTGCTDSNDSISPTVDGSAERSDLITIGFVAVGPEGAWRAANEASMQNTFTEEAGFELIYSPATNADQKSQLDAFTTFVDQGVDLILLSATEGSGWEDSLQRAQAADIPVILIDRGIEPDDQSLYVTRIAPDNTEVARNVAEWALSEYPEGATYYVLEGPAGVSVVNERNRGWDEVMATHPEFVKIGAQTANWSEDEGELVIESVLAENNNQVAIIFAQNDEMGLGAITAVKAAGLEPGVDVKIATIDGTRGAMEALYRGELSFVAEYNPLFGPTALEVVNDVLAGNAVDKAITVPSNSFTSITEADLAAREY